MAPAQLGKQEALKKFAVDLAYTYYDNSAKYDNFSDRDFISLGLSTTF